MDVLRCKVNPYFELNKGQLPNKVKYKVKANDYTTYFTKDKLVVSLPSNKINTRNVFYMKLENKNKDVDIKGIDKQIGIVNYFLGKDESKWISNIPTYSKIKYEQIYNNIDIYYYINGKNLEYDFVLSKEANINDICISFEGTDEIEINEDNEIIITVGDIKAILLKPIAYQIINNIKTYVECEYTLDKNNILSFMVFEYEKEHELVIDPVLSLEYSTYIGGSKSDYGMSLAIDSEGCVYITGYTEGGYPTNSGQINFGGGYMDAFITKLNTNGNELIYSTYLGGNNGDFSKGIAIDSGGYAYVTGLTYSSDFPVTNGAYQTTYSGNGDVFVTKLNTSGQMLMYSTYIGGSGFNIGNSIAVDDIGYAYITGQTENNYPTTQEAYQTIFTGTKDAFVTKIDINGSKLIYSTYLGGSSSVCGKEIIVDEDRCAYITGYAGPNYPTTKGAYQKIYGGGNKDIFVSKLDKNGSELMYSTYIGGEKDDSADAIALDSVGNIYIVGYTKGTYPTLNSYQSTFSGNRDIVVSKLDKEGSELIYSTYIGNSETEHGYAISIDTEGYAYIVGYASGDIFLSKLSNDGSKEINYTSFSDGTDNYGKGIAVDSKGYIYVCGYSQSGYPTTKGAYQTKCLGEHDAIVSKVLLLDFDLYWECKQSKAKLLDTITIKLIFKNLITINLDTKFKYGLLDSSLQFVENTLFINNISKTSSTLPTEIYLSNISPLKTAEIEFDLKYINDIYPEQIPITSTVEIYNNETGTPVLVDTIITNFYIDTTIGANYIPGCNSELYNLEVGGTLQTTETGAPIIYYKTGNSYIYTEPNKDRYIYKVLSNPSNVEEYNIYV